VFSCVCGGAAHSPPLLWRLQVPVYYLDIYLRDFLSPDQSRLLPTLLRAPVPFEEKLDAVAYVNSNCETLSPRAEIMRGLMRLVSNSTRVKVLSYGKCDNNTPMPGPKQELIARHKFCVAMENSITKDYVTEKLWDALIAGCVPIYLGPPNARDFLPDPDAAIVYGAGSNITTPEALMAELERLAGDRSAYERMMAWKKKTRVEEFAPAFQNLIHQIEFRPSMQCNFCQMIAAHRQAPKNYTTCLFNSTWNSTR
jgi:hypothetical protein